ncbi:MAG: ZIP family zinc transporter [Patescibacteria group bacterium]|jgi:ZIP family zinc transporter
MEYAVLYGAISGLALVGGAAVGIYFNFSQRVIARFMAFGAGVLVCALTFGLMEDAFSFGGFDAVTIGFLIGGLAYVLGDYLLHFYGGRNHKRRKMIETGAITNGRAITLGAILDGIPESAALGISLFAGHGRGFLMAMAIVISNFPEGISSITGLKKEGYSNKKIFTTWAIVAITTLVITILSYIFLTDIDPNNIGIIEAFAAGAILAMLADTMMPEAYEEGGFSIGIITVLGFLAAFILAKF